MKNLPVYFFWIIFAIVLGLGNVLLIFNVSTNFLFPFAFVLGAALPTFGVIAFASQRLGAPVSYKHMFVTLVLGGTLSVGIAIALEIFLSIIVYFLFPPLAYLGNPALLRNGFFSPLVIFFLILVAIQAPIPEEFTKGLSAAIAGSNIENERQALLIGICAGAGFAIIENMIYEGLYTPRGGWSWGGVTALRGIGSVLHPLCTGIVSLGLYRARQGQLGAWFKAGLTAIGLHTLWNGGFIAFVYLTGLEYYASRNAPAISVYGMPISMLLVVFLLALAVGLWWMLYRLTRNLAQGVQAEVTPLTVSSKSIPMM